MESVRRMSTVFLQVRRRSSILEPWRSISRVTCTSCVRMLSSEWTARLDSFPPCSRYPTASRAHRTPFWTSLTWLWDLMATCTSVMAQTVGSDGTIYFSTLEPYVFCITPQDGKLQVVNIGLPEQQTPLGEYDIPSYISVDEQGHLFVAQANRSRVLRIVLKTGVVSTYAGGLCLPFYPNSLIRQRRCDIRALT